MHDCAVALAEVEAGHGVERQVSAVEAVAALVASVASVAWAGAYAEEEILVEVLALGSGHGAVREQTVGRASLLQSLPESSSLVSGQPQTEQC